MRIQIQGFRVKSKSSGIDTIPEQIPYAKYPILHIIIFFHPDFTVGLGISPNHALRLVGFTTGRESHPALKTSIQFGQYYIRLI